MSKFKHCDIKTRIAIHDRIGGCLARNGVMNRIDIGYRYPSIPIDFHEPLGIDKSIPLGNMSLCRMDDDKWLISVRQFNYKIRLGNDKGGWFGGFLDKRAYFFVVTDDEFRFLDRIECDFDVLPMYEDLRLVRYGNMIQASGTDASFGQDRYRYGCILFEIQGKKLKMVSRYTFPEIRGKNYMPIEDGAGVFIPDMMQGSINITSRADIAKKRSRNARVWPHIGDLRSFSAGETDMSAWCTASIKIGTIMPLLSSIRPFCSAE